MVTTQEVEYEVDGKKMKFTYRRLKYGEYQSVMSQVGQVELVGGVTRSKIDTTRLIDELMKKSVSGEVDYHQLDVSDGIDLQDRVLSFNGMAEQQNFRAKP